MESVTPIAPAKTIDHEKVLALHRSVSGVIRGKDEAIQLAIVTLLAGGHLLLEDVPGVGKTTLAHALARSFNCTFQRIQFTSDLLPSDIIGVSVYTQATQEFSFKPGPLFANVILADEINRTTPKTQSSLLEAMNEGQVTVENRTYVLPRPFMVLATQNPIEHHGTYPLPESQLDRFMMRITIGYPGMESEKEILLRQTQDGPVAGVKPVLSSEEILLLQQKVRTVKVDESLLEYALRIVERTRQHEHLVLGVSPRGSLALYHSAQALAFVEGRDYVLPDDLKRLTGPVFAHRLVVNSKFASTLKKIEQSEMILDEILDSVEVPL
ncbi:MAG: MoxR family ATPase [Acidobacteriia bacterium]|nr:MoxR family ATPase [Terriglobia bacterium]